MDDSVEAGDVYSSDKIVG